MRQIIRTAVHGPRTLAENRAALPFGPGTRAGSSKIASWPKPVDMMPNCAWKWNLCWRRVAARSVWSIKLRGPKPTTWRRHATVLTPGERLGPYQILGLLGEGGMGKVYRGLDTRLDRAVAIKISAEQFSNRFEREARAISALNHPHICTLYDVGPNYMVTELVEGETLRDWLKRAPAVERSLEIARQVLEALRAAHRAGIVHRDLKPQNIMVRFDGYVKVLDFGLAKRMPVSRGLPDREHRIDGCKSSRSDPRDGRLHVTRADPGKAKSISAATCSRSGSFSTKC